MKIFLYLFLILSIGSFAQEVEGLSPSVVEQAVQEASHELAREKGVDVNQLQVTSVGLVEDPNQKAWRIYIIWGYNRSWHAPSDANFKTQYGDFTIHQARAVDRPSDFTFEKYFNPQNISIPQYNFRIGFEKNHRRGEWGVELGQDHMKWVFENQYQYEITGEYEAPLWTWGENGLQSISFDEIKNAGSAVPFKFEYSDGHNYVHLSSFYNLNIVKTPKNRLRFSLGADGGVGLYIPRPHARILSARGWHEGENGKFQISGFGVHLGLKGRLTFFERVFLESSLRGVGVTNKSHFTSPQEMIIKHDFMKSLEYYAGVGVIVKRFGNKKNRKNENRSSR